jgi:hypothetical protein
MAAVIITRPDPGFESNEEQSVRGGGKILGIPGQCWLADGRLFGDEMAIEADSNARRMDPKQS